jgi:hypothetical protein
MAISVELEQLQTLKRPQMFVETDGLAESKIKMET